MKKVKRPNAKEAEVLKSKIQQVEQVRDLKDPTWERGNQLKAHSSQTEKHGQPKATHILPAQRF